MRMCQWFPSGNCRQGWRCMFAHSVNELHPLARGQGPWEITSGYVVFSASWFDSGHICMPIFGGGYCFRIQRNAWSSVVHAMRQLRSWARSLCPCCATTGIWSDSAESRAGAAVAVYRRSLLPFVPQRQIPHGRACSEHHRDSAVAVVQVVDAPVVQVVVHDRGSDYAYSRSYSSGRSVECWVSGASGLPTAPAIFHVPRLSGVYLGVSLRCPVLSTDHGPRILLDFLCTSGGVSQLVPTSSGYTWISRELHAVHIMLVPSLRVGFLGALCTGTGPGTWLPHNSVHRPAGMDRHVR